MHGFVLVHACMHVAARTLGYWHPGVNPNHACCVQLRKNVAPVQLTAAGFARGATQPMSPAMTMRRWEGGSRGEGEVSQALECAIVF